MDNIILTLVYPSFLGKIKPYQNFSLIISGLAILLAFTLSWFDNKLVLDIAMYLFLSGIILLIPFILLSLPFLLKKIEIIAITNGVISIETDHNLTEINIQKLSFLLNVDRKLLENKDPLISEITKDLSAWGNYIIIPAENSLKVTYIQFIPDESFLELLPQLKIETYKSRPILMNDTTDLLKSFMDMLWSASR